MKTKHKTKKAVAKRFRLTKKGKLKRSSTGRGHLLGHKSRKRKRHLRRGGYVSAADQNRIAMTLTR
jgi:large subunit ribosomal protein L35